MILDEILEMRKKRLEQEREADFYGVLPYLRGEKSFEASKRSLKKAIDESPGMGVIAEVKRASPSKGLICADFDPVKIAEEYEQAGASCLSVLTEEDYFLGKAEYLRRIREQTELPILRKDFIFDEYQIFEARCMGADGILLICRLFDRIRLKELKAAADRAGLEVLFEVRSEKEIEMAQLAGAELIGINNRDLSSFRVDLGTTEQLISKIPDGVTVISESGIGGRMDVERLKKRGVKGILVGETLMKAVDKCKKMRELTLKKDKKTALQVKICGIKTMADVEGVRLAAPDYVGFVLAESPRRVEYEQLNELIEGLRGKIIPVGVFVNPTIGDIKKAVDKGIKIIQLHGEEPQSLIDEINRRYSGKLEIWKALRLDEKNEVLLVPEGITAVVLDKFSEQAYGGTGERIEKKLLQKAVEELKQKGNQKIVLAGGLNEKNLEEALHGIAADCVDTSSGVETDRKKDRTKMAAFVKTARAI